ncbi:hypothetical protein [Dankookia sp. P2]|uniref:hypothetical protein n=1 Tax=Dankookia sp. P2 TaxID=3423955 RepID=UPI003D66F66A
MARSPSCCTRSAAGCRRRCSSCWPRRSTSWPWRCSGPAPGKLRGVAAPGWAVALPLVPWYAACAVPAVYASAAARVGVGTLLFAILGTAGGIELLRLRGSATLRRAARTVAIIALFANSLPVWRLWQFLQDLPVTFSGAGHLLGVLLFVVTGFAGLALASILAGERDAGLAAAAAQRRPRRWRQAGPRSSGCWPACRPSSSCATSPPTAPPACSTATAIPRR